MRGRYVVLTVLYCLGLFWLSSGSNPVHPEMWFPEEDKVVHAMLYAGLAAVVSTGLRRSGKPVASWVQMWFPILFAGLYGATDEFHQRFVPNRTCDVWDLAADVAGALIIQVILAWRPWQGSPKRAS